MNIIINTTKVTKNKDHFKVLKKRFKLDAVYLRLDGVISVLSGSQTRQHIKTYLFVLLDIKMEIPIRLN